ncbi:DUF6380 family protein [Streptomyces sp. NPDC004286]
MTAAETEADPAARPRRATLARGVASLTAKAGRARFNQHARHARKDAA